MTFEQMLPALKQGKKVRRSSWNNKDTYYKYDKVKMAIFFYDGEYSLNYGFYNSELFADDWEIVDNITPLSIPMECNFVLDDIKTDNEHFWIVTELPYKPEYIKQFKQLRVTFTPVIREDDNE